MYRVCVTCNEKCCKVEWHARRCFLQQQHTRRAVGGVFVFAMMKFVCSLSHSRSRSRSSGKRVKKGWGKGLEKAFRASAAERGACFCGTSQPCSSANGPRAFASHDDFLFFLGCECRPSLRQHRTHGRGAGWGERAADAKLFRLKRTNPPFPSFPPFPPDSEREID